MGNYRVFKRRADGSGIDTHFECLSINQMDSIARGMYFKEEEENRLPIKPIKPELPIIDSRIITPQNNFLERPKLYDPLEGLLSKKKPWEPDL